MDQKLGVVSIVILMFFFKYLVGGLETFEAAHN